MGILDGLIGSVTSIGTLPGKFFDGFANDFFNRRSVKYQNGLQQRNARYWAEYNSPVNQIARLREAGLNPALVYGNGTAVTTYDGKTPVSGLSNNPKITDGLSSLLMGAQVKNLRKQDELLESQKKSVEEDIKSKQLDNARKQASNPIQMGMNDLQSIINDNNLKLEEITRRNTENQNLRLENDILKVKKQLIDLDLDFKSTYGRGQEYLKMLNSAAALKYAELQNDTYLERWLYQKNYTIAQIKEIQATISNLYALADLNKAIKDKTVAITDNLKIDKAIKALEAQLKSYNLPAEVIDAYLTPVVKVIGAAKGGFSSSRTQNNIIYNYGE